MSCISYRREAGADISSGQTETRIKRVEERFRATAGDMFMDVGLRSFEQVV